MADLDLKISFNSNGWGPINGTKLDIIEGVPYSHFDKKSKFTKHADFVQQNMSIAHQRHLMMQRRREAEILANAGPNDFSYKHDDVEDSTFQLVDTSKTTSRRPGRNAKNIGRGALSNRSGNKSRVSATAKGEETLNTFHSKGGKFGKYKNKKRGKIDRLPSLTIGGEWEMLEEFDLAQLLKLKANPPTVEDLKLCGHIDKYDDTYDKLTTRSARSIRRTIENKVFYDVTTSDDPEILNFRNNNVGQVYATDSILAQLVAAPRSVYSWDIVIQKLGGALFLDKRENSSFDYLTVSETALEPPQATDETETYNRPEQLSLEATAINQNFSQQVLLPSERIQCENNPFFAEKKFPGMAPASTVYRYRKYTLGNINLVARTELHCWHSKKSALDKMYGNAEVDDEEKMSFDKATLMTCHAVNEWDSKNSGGVNWRQKIDQQPGAVLATELKNNSCKFARWTAQALLSGADQMKLGYVSRVAPNNPYEHSILATQYFKPSDLASQINLSVTNIWGIIKMIIELFNDKPEGKYVLLKDPNKAILRLYSVPINYFDDDEEEEEEEEDGENEDEGEFGDDEE